MATLVQQLGSGSSGKVLYLHGWRTSGEIMKMQCRDVTHGTSSAFLDGAHAATGPPQDIVAAIWPGLPYYEWWNMEKDAEGKTVYNGLDVTLKAIRNYDKKFGPFTSVIGFSQGGCLTAVLAALSEKSNVLGGEAPPLPSLKSAVIMNAFVPNEASLLELFDSVGPLKSIKLLHVIAKKDGLREQGVTLNEMMGGSLLEHAGGHEVANNSNGKQVVAGIRSMWDE